PRSRGKPDARRGCRCWLPDFLEAQGSTIAASAAIVLSARGGCVLIRRARRSTLGRNESKALDGAAQLVRAHVRVALRGVEVLVTEQLLDLAQVGAGGQQLGGEHVTERVGRHAFASRYASGFGVAAKRHRHNRGGETVAEYAREQGRMVARRTCTAI